MLVGDKRQHRSVSAGEPLKLLEERAKQLNARLTGSRFLRGLLVPGGLRRDLSMAFKERFVQVGLVFLLVLFAIVMYNDVVRLLPSHS